MDQAAMGVLRPICIADTGNSSEYDGHMKLKLKEALHSAPAAALVFCWGHIAQLLSTPSLQFAFRPRAARCSKQPSICEDHQGCV